MSKKKKKKKTSRGERRRRKEKPDVGELVHSFNVNFEGKRVHFSALLNTETGEVASIAPEGMNPSAMEIGKTAVRERS